MDSEDYRYGLYEGRKERDWFWADKCVEILAEIYVMYYGHDRYAVMAAEHHIEEAITKRFGPFPEEEPSYRKKKIGNGLRTKVYERDNYTCQECGARKNLTVDHVVPESKGGETTADNLRTLCRSCNSRKGARP